MVADRTRELLFPITILISVAIGVGIGSVLGRTGNDSHAPIQASGTDSQAIVDAIDAVRAELVRMQERLDASKSPAAQPDRTDLRSTATADGTSELHKATETLEKAADSLRSAIAGFGGGSAPLVTPRSVDPHVWVDFDHQRSAEDTKSYMLWNFQQVLDRFGPPDQFGQGNSPGATYWVYRHSEKKVTFFRFIDGLVAAVQTEG
jgi:hypothetical protein